MDPDVTVFWVEHVDGDLSQLFVGAEYRRAGSEEWVDIVRRNGHDLQAEGAASFFASWMPADDGQYEVRGFTQCGAPANRVATVATVGTVDTHAPAVFAPEPRDNDAWLGVFKTTTAETATPVFDPLMP